MVRLVVRHGAGLALVGVAAGLVAAALLTRLMASLLYGVGALDPLTFAVTPLALIAVALIACFAPARHATRIDPITALHHE